MKSHPKSRASISDFKFITAGYGHFLVRFTDPATGQTYQRITDEMPLIDATKNADEPSQSNIDKLIRFVSRGSLPE